MHHNHKHGQSGNKTSLYTAWVNMRDRCDNPNHKAYHNYGGRGIKVCSQWYDFITFAKDVGPPPRKGLSLDRKNNNGNYEPGNVRWETKRTQARNSRFAKLDQAKADQIRAVYAQGKLAQWKVAQQFGVCQMTVSLIVQGKMW